jgi:gliding motility-associated-like protein
LSKGLNRFLWTVTRGACLLEDMVDINVLNLIIPEGFSPNNDPENYNNTFIINGLDLPNQTAELVIVNGAGAEVFSTSNRNGNNWRDWDGKNSKGIDLPEATYYYLLKITSKGNGQVFKKSGFVILKRY